MTERETDLLTSAFFVISTEGTNLFHYRQLRYRQLKFLPEPVPRARFLPPVEMTNEEEVEMTGEGLQLAAGEQTGPLPFVR